MRRGFLHLSILFILVIATLPAGTEAQRYSISGRIEIEGRTDHSGIIVWVDPMNSDMTGPTGDFEITEVSPGAYALCAWAPHCLSTIIDTAYVSLSDLSSIRGWLFPGDVYQDGRINLHDTGEMLKALHADPDSALWDPVLDLDGNSVIDSLDLVLLIDHWKEEDEVEVPAWQIGVLEPGAEDIWWLGQQSVEIRWTTANLGGDVAIYLLHAGMTVDTIAQATPNDGEFSGYDVPSDLVDDGGYNVLVKAEDPIAGISGNFALRSALVISNPDSTDAWRQGEYAGINWWNRAGSTSDVSLYLYKGDELRYTIIEGRQYDREFYDWTVPADAESGDDYRVKASYDDSPKIAGYSDYFSIRPRFRVIKPNWTTVWLAEQRGIVVTWEDTDLGGTVSISLFRGGTEIDVIESAAPNTGEYIDYDYVIPSSLIEDYDYNIRVRYDRRYQDHSEDFLIRKPLLPQTGGWINISPRPALYDVSVSSENVATAVGYNGRILRTEDGGDNWKEFDRELYQHLYGVSLIGDLTGYAVGVDGLILKTSDGGATWSRLRPYVTETLLDVHQISDTHVVAVGANGLIIRTLNGGTTWVVLPSGIDDDLSAVHFTDSFNGWAVGKEHSVIRTYDGGDTWSEFDTGYYGWTLTDIEFYGSIVGAMIGYYPVGEGYCTCYLLMTSDGGNTWGPHGPFRGYCVNSGVLAFTDESTLIATTHWMRRTVDGGATWTAPASENIFSTNYGIDFSDGDIGVAAGSYGTLIRSEDAGATWLNTASVYTDLIDVVHVDANTVVAIGSEGMILRTVDGGLNWNQVPSSTYSALLRSLDFAGPDTAMIAGDDGLILSSVDGGLSWSPSASGFSGRLFGIEMINGQIALSVGDDGTILRTPDGGISWNMISSGTTVTLRAVSFGTAENGHAVGYNGTVLRTADGGFTWTELDNPQTNNLYDVEFLDALNGIAVGQEIILRTSDGGDTWESFPVEVNIALTSVDYSGADTVTAVGSAGRILRSYDGGGTWTRQPCNSSNWLRGVSFQTSLEAIIVGYGGTILRTETGGE